MATLGALLLNPPLGGGERTIRRLWAVAELLECDRMEIANLFAVATRDLTAINQLGRTRSGWEEARPRLRQVIMESDHLLAGWGVGGLVGQAAEHKDSQMDTVRAYMRETGKDLLWTLNGETRHPSRWHQYVSDRHGRASGASLSDRIGQVLRLVPISTLH